MSDQTAFLAHITSFSRHSLQATVGFHKRTFPERFPAGVRIHPLGDIHASQSFDSTGTKLSIAVQFESS
jgi:hypothetical protein